MVGNILTVGLMSLGMGLSGVKNEPQKAQNNWQIVIKNDTPHQEVLNFIKASYDVTIEQSNLTPYQKIDIYDIDNDHNYSYTTYTIDSITDNTLELYVPQAGNSELYIYLDDTTTALSYTQESETVLYFEITITSKAVYQKMQNMIGTDPEEAGADIIGSIASGLGLIVALATEFLAGFTNLFYSAGALTPFAIFSLVMLGIAVSFAVVKLVLNLIRSNTGA